MKNFFRHNWILLIIVVIAVTTVSLTRTRAVDDLTSNSAWLSTCSASGLDIPEQSPYADFQKGTEDIMTMYHQTINSKFNDYLKMMIAGQSQAAKTGTPDPNSIPPELDDTTGLPKDCDDNNYSTYCVGTKLLTSQYGYITYSKVLDCRQSELFDSKQEALSYSDYMETILSAGISNPGAIKKSATIAPYYQEQKTLEVSARVAAITREKSSAKRALDQTLSAYNELKTALPMHKRYQEIYKQLVKFRNKMAEIRQQVEQLPGKFIDATTTKCT